MSLLDHKLNKTLQAYLQSQEFRRSKSPFPEETIDKVLRYAAPLGSLVEQYDEIPRCMDRLKEMAAAGDGVTSPLPNGTVVIAKKLKSGCGRFAREWHAPAGGLWIAVAWADSLLPEYARLLPLAAGIASCEAVRTFGIDATIKWVNDVHAGGRKIAGVLCETMIGSYPEDIYHLVGIGINCNNSSFPQELQESATSMYRELGKIVDMDRFTLIFLANLAWNFGLVHLYEETALAWERDGRPGILVNPLVEAWKDLSDTLNRRVLYGYDVVREPMYQATVLDIDESGALIMELENGATVTENSGEIMYLND